MRLLLRNYRTGIRGAKDEHFNKEDTQPSQAVSRGLVSHRNADTEHLSLEAGPEGP